MRAAAVPQVEDGRRPPSAPRTQPRPSRNKRHRITTGRSGAGGGLPGGPPPPALPGEEPAGRQRPAVPAGPRRRRRLLPRPRSPPRPAGTRGPVPAPGPPPASFPAAARGRAAAPPALSHRCRAALTTRTEPRTTSETLCRSSAAVPGLLSARVNLRVSGAASAMAAAAGPSRSSPLPSRPGRRAAPRAAAVRAREPRRGVSPLLSGSPAPRPGRRAPRSHLRARRAGATGRRRRRGRLARRARAPPPPVPGAALRLGGRLPARRDSPPSLAQRGAEAEVRGGADGRRKLPSM